LQKTLRIIEVAIFTACRRPWCR